jgi:hypothetical protein
MTGRRWRFALVALLFGTVSLALTAFAWLGTGTPSEDGRTRLLGVVEDGKLIVLDPYYAPRGVVRLTAIPMVAAQPPVSGEVDLSGYEGRAIMVLGHDGGGWVYSAEVVDQADPILTAVVRRVFQPEKVGEGTE